MTGAFDFDPDRFIERSDEPTTVQPLRPMPREWEHGLQLLADRPLPHGASEGRWAQVVADAIQIASRYKDACQAAGWDMANLFGYDPDQPQGFVGLAVRLRGRLLVDISSRVAVIKGDSGYIWHRPHMPADAPLLWNFKEARPRR